MKNSTDLMMLNYVGVDWSLRWQYKIGNIGNLLLQLTNAVIFLFLFNWLLIWLIEKNLQSIKYLRKIMKRANYRLPDHNVSS